MTNRSNMIEESSVESLRKIPLGDLSGMQRDVLYVIAGIDDGTVQTGVVIREMLEESHPESVSHGGFYHNLRSLTEEEYLDRVPLDGRTNTYRLSEKALRALEERHEWASGRLGIDSR